ncbi:S-adenosylmethionine:tRNA ribosyltransferase-isomerase, partial [Streptomyces sp. Ru87]|uniref:S-adenosylmethionine:tRNA ribosyltransferase-isomerase n=1 Tax=Streptomyces sp. Ru87 TaxID=2044307 RepID=UPI00117C9601
GGRVPALMERYGRPVRYGYTERDQPLSAYQTVFAERPVYAEPPGPPGRVPCPAADGGGARQGSAPQAPGDGSSEGAGDGSAEMPSAARPFTAELVAELVSRGVQVAPLRLHTGVASAEAYEPPYPERFAVPEATAWLVNAARAAGGRVVAVGTTAVRALESAAGTDGVVRAAAGWTDLVVTPRRGVRVVDGLLTGLHEPEASHLLMLEAVAGRAGPAGRAALVRGYAAALAERYLWHEFGDSHLILSR